MEAVLARLGLAAVLLTAAGCSTRVSLGGELGQGGDSSTPTPSGGAGAIGNAGGSGGANPCEGLPCGANCGIEEDCADDGDNCAAYAGFCDEEGSCQPQQPACTIEECGGQPCGAPCTVCTIPDCDDDPAPGGGLFCDGYGSCAPQVYCDPCQRSIYTDGLQRCGVPCDPCEYGFPEAPDCPPSRDLFVCDGHGVCVYTERLECPAYDSCAEPSSTCGSPCSLCAPNSPDYRACMRQEMSEPPKVCDAWLTCVPIDPVFPECP